jgi:hypothetical protein
MLPSDAGRWTFTIPLLLPVYQEGNGHAPLQLSLFSFSFCGRLYLLSPVAGTKLLIRIGRNAKEMRTVDR